MTLYEKMTSIANNCEHQLSYMCSKRNKLRNCYRPLCCGFCPTNTECDGICSPINNKLKEGEEIE